MAKQCLGRGIIIEPDEHTVEVKFNGRTIASTGYARSLKEADYLPVLYIPLKDVDPHVLTPSDHHTVCPFKGEASYYSLKQRDAVSDNAVWYYPDPCPLVEDIKGYVAFWGEDIEYDT